MNNSSLLRGQSFKKFTLPVQRAILNDIYIAKSKGEYDKAIRLGDDFINNVDIHSSPYTKEVLMNIGDVAYKAKKSPEILFQYLDLYIELYNEFDENLLYMIKDNILEPLSNLDSESLKTLIIKPKKSTKKIIEILIYQKNPNYEIHEAFSNKSSFTKLLYLIVELYPEAMPPIYQTAIEYIKEKKYAELENVYFSDKNNLYMVGLWIMDSYLRDDRLEDAEKFYSTEKEIFSDVEYYIFNNYIKLTVKRVGKYIDEKDYKSAEKELSDNLGRLSNKELLYLLFCQSNIYSYDIAQNNFILYSENLKSEMQLQNTIWYYLAEMFKGKLTPVEITEKVSSDNDIPKRIENLCIANCFIGIKYMFEGSSTVANQYFSNSFATEKVDLLEYRIAKNQLENTVDINLQVNKNIKTIAVLDFEADGFTSTEAKVITKRFASNLNNRNIFNMLERAEMEEIIKEQKFQLSGCTTSECAVEVGQLLGVQLMLAGSIGRFGDINILEVRIIDIETGKIVKTASVDIIGKKELLITEGVKKALDILSN